ncbi:MAG: TlpA family protein disulfide reductase [Acidobacteria bacterium]|nr:TlpA family protein disulfide reductase [Acidobacteriota bacterium]
MSDTTPEQPDTRTPAPEKGGAWTTARVLLSALVFVGLALAFSSSSCNPTDDTANAPRADADANSNGAVRPRGTPSAPSAEATPVALPDEIRNTELRALDGKGFKLADYQGKVLVLNLWTTWCRPCRDEMPQLVEFYDDYRGRGVEVLGLTMEDDRGNTPEAVKESVRDLKINYRVAWAEQELYARFLAPGFEIPQTYIIDREGRIRRKLRGGGAHVGNFIRATVDDILAGKT